MDFLFASLMQWGREQGHGEHFYNFQGLRLVLPGVLTGVASLVSRGLGGVVAR